MPSEVCNVSGLPFKRMEAQPTVVWLFDVDAVLAEREREVVHGKNDTVAVHTGCGATASRRRAVDTELGKVEGIAREVRDELLGREGEKTFPRQGVSVDNTR